jgi:hypothetical protein
MPEADRGSRGEVLALGALAAAAFLFRLAIARAMPIIEVDGAYWCGFAGALARGDWAHGLSSAWPPLYPLAIALASRLGPLGPPSPEALEAAARLVSAVAGAVLLIPLNAIGRRLLLAPARWIALLIAAVHPRLVEYSTAALSESLFTLLLVASLAAWVRAHEGGASRRSSLWEAGAGAGMGLAFLTRAEAFPLALALWLVSKVVSPSRRRLAFLGALLAVCGPWLLFLHARTGEWTLGEKGTYNFWRAHRAAYARHFPEPRALPDRVNRSPEIAPPAVPHEVRVAEFVAREPVAVARTTGANLLRLFFSTLPVCVGWPVVLLALFGLFLPRAGPWSAILGPLAILPLLIAPFSVDRRFLVPLVPLAILLAVLALDGIARRRRSWSLALAAALVLGLALYTVGIPRRADRAPELRRAGKWLEGLTGAGDSATRPPLVVMGRKPWVAFYSGSRIADLHDAPADSILTDAAGTGADVIVADAASTRGDRRQLEPWLDSARAPVGWRVLARWDDPVVVLLAPDRQSAGSIR